MPTFSPGQALPAGPLLAAFCGFCVTSRCNFELGVEIVEKRGGIDASLKQRKGDPVGGTQKRLSMSAATSPGTGLAYGLRRVCAAWGMARSFYAMTSGQQRAPPAKRRGPKPAILDQALQVAIEADLEASPWEPRATARSSASPVATSGLPASGCSAGARKFGSSGNIVKG